MDIRTIDPRISVSPQIGPEDVKVIAGAGFRSIVCNCADDGGEPQPVELELRSQVKAAGLSFAYVPVQRTFAPGGSGVASVFAMVEVLRMLPGPVLAYCGSGGCATKLAIAALAQIQTDV